MKKIISKAVYLLALIVPSMAYAYESGSTGVDGAFSPAVSTQLTLPPSGIFNFTNINIPAGVTITFAKNANNTPAILLATGDVIIDGVIHVNGSRGGAENDGSPGAAGVGGFIGGRGGLRAGTGFARGGNGLGPGGGEGAVEGGNRWGAGGSFGTTGKSVDTARPGAIYGSPDLRTLIGGSGGGGGGGDIASGPGGSGGGGAILIAASGTMIVNGTISAKGGDGRNFQKNSAPSGGGSGGAVRLVSTTLQGEGIISAEGGGGLVNGGHGRIRLEAENMQRASDTLPRYSFGSPAPAFYSNFPSLRIASIGGTATPSNPNGFRDVVLPGLTVNPVTVSFETSNIPLGTTIKLTAAPERGTAATATSTGVSGSSASGIATADINLPAGNSTLFGVVSFTITVASNSQAAGLSKYAKNEKVEKYRVSVNTEGESETTFITASGKEYTWPSNLITIN